MKLFNSLLFIYLLTALVADQANAEEASAKTLNLGQAYLSHWFSYDSAEAINLTLKPVASDEFGRRAEINFTSDDGLVVNGLIGFPNNKTDANKLALALHPMGTDLQFWWGDKSPLATQRLTAHLRQQGYIVISLDARLHGERGRKGFGPRELIQRAHSAEPRVYIDTIIGSVRDYRIVLNWARKEFKPDQILAMGYSMGAQMSLLLASYEPSVNSVLTMVPPFVGSATSPVAPRIHVNRITDAKVLWLAGAKDPHSNRDQTQHAFNIISSPDKMLTWFDAGHRLPPKFLDVALSFLDSIHAEANLSKRGE